MKHKLMMTMIVSAVSPDAAKLQRQKNMSWKIRNMSIPPTAISVS